MRPVPFLLAMLCAGLPWSGSRPQPLPPSPALARAAISPPSRESCRAGKDLVVQARELLRVDSTAAQLGDANELLKRASDLCIESGDVWYFRSLLERKLGHASIAEYAMRQARLFPSDALTEGLNPFILAAPPDPHLTPSTHPGQRWALVVGIGAFADRSIKPLQFSRGDATLFHDVLLDPHSGAFPPDHIRLLTDRDASLRGIKEGLNWLARSAAPDDLVVIYIASHGSSRELDTAGANYIITNDTEIGSQVDPDALYATALPMVDLSTSVANRIQARRIAVFIDTCYSGGAAEPGARLLAPGVATAAVSRGTLSQITQGAGRVIFAASRTDQESLESPALQHGYFTWFLTQSLRAHPGAPLTNVFEDVRQHVSAQVDKDYRLYGLHQEPIMSRSSDQTDFPLAESTPSVAQLTRP